MSKVLVVKALEDGVNVLFTSPDETPNHQPERLDKGEVLVIAAPVNGETMRVRGIAEVYTPDYMVNSESGLVIGGRTDEKVTEE